MARRANYGAVRMRAKMRRQGTDDALGAPGIMAPLLKAARAAPPPAASPSVSNRNKASQRDAAPAPDTAKRTAAQFLRWRARRAMLQKLDAEAEAEHGGAE